MEKEQSQQSIENEKLRLERQRLAADVRLKRREQQLQREQLALDKQLKEAEQRLEREKFEASRRGWAAWAQSFTPVGAAVVAGLVGLFGTVVNGYQNNALEKIKQNANETLERQKLESALILKMSEVSDSKLRAQNMVFFAEHGFLSLENQYLDSLRDKAGLKPGIPAPPPSLPNPRSVDLEASARSAYMNVLPQIRNIQTGSPTGRKVLDVAIDELRYGAWEGDTRGEENILKYWQTLGMTGKDVNTLPWSAAFVSYCLSQATGKRMFKPVAAHFQLESQFRDKGWLHPAGPKYHPQPGDVFFMLRGNQSTQIRHGGIVLNYDPKTRSFTTIEGNVGNILGTRTRKNEPPITFGHIP